MKIKKIVIVVCVLMVSCLLINLVSYADTINPNLLGIYRDEENSEAYINAKNTEVYVIRFCYRPDNFMNGYADTYTLTAADFIAVCNNATIVDEDGNILGNSMGETVAQGNVDLNQQNRRTITSKRGYRVYVK